MDEGHTFASNKDHDRDTDDSMLIHTPSGHYRVNVLRFYFLVRQWRHCHNIEIIGGKAMWI